MTWIKGTSYDSGKRVWVRHEDVVEVEIYGVQDFPAPPGPVTLSMRHGGSVRIRKTPHLRQQIEALLGERLSTYRNGVEW